MSYNYAISFLIIVRTRNQWSDLWTAWWHVLCEHLARKQRGLLFRWSVKTRLPWYRGQRIAQCTTRQSWHSAIPTGLFSRHAVQCCEIMLHSPVLVPVERSLSRQSQLTPLVFCYYLWVYNQTTTSSLCCCLISIKRHHPGAVPNAVTRNCHGFMAYAKNARRRTLIHVCLYAYNIN